MTSIAETRAFLFLWSLYQVHIGLAKILTGDIPIHLYSFWRLPLKFLVLDKVFLCLKSENLVCLFRPKGFEFSLETLLTLVLVAWWFDLFLETLSRFFDFFFHFPISRFREQVRRFSGFLDSENRWEDC